MGNIEQQIGFIRSEMQGACPSVRVNDREWILALIVTEVEKAYAEGLLAGDEWISPRKSLPDEDHAVLVAVMCEWDDHDGGTQRWEEVHEATMYRAGCNLVAACYAENAEYMDDEILGWRELPSPPVPSKEPK